MLNTVKLECDLVPRLLHCKSLGEYVVDYLGQRYWLEEEFEKK